MSKELFVYFSTPDSDYKGTLAHRSVLKMIELGILKPENWMCKTNNKDSLAVGYNTILNSDRVTGKILILMHSDLCIDDMFVKDKLEKRFTDFPKAALVGVAGGRRIMNRPDKPCLWHIMTVPNELSGEVSQNVNGDLLTPIVTTRFGLQAKRVIIVDGCFMAVDVDRIRAAGVTFDEDSPSKFNFYDLIFSLRCYWAGLEVYVDSIHVVHTSPGLTNRTKDFDDGNEYFKKEYISKLFR